VLGKSAIGVLHTHLEDQHNSRKSVGEKWIENNLIFPCVIGTPLDPANIYHSFKDLLRVAGLPDIRFQDLRHTATTIMLQQNIHPKVVQERLGHSDIRLTLNTYSHVMPGMQEEAVDKIDEVLTKVDVKDALKKAEPEQVKK